MMNEDKWQIQRDMKKGGKLRTRREQQMDSTVKVMTIDGELP